jgi:hypothetical protein
VSPCCEDEDPPCECVRIDVDLYDNRACPAHGPWSEAARRQREQEAADEAAYWQSGYVERLLGVNWSNES